MFYQETTTNTHVLVLECHHMEYLHRAPTEMDII